MAITRRLADDDGHRAPRAAILSLRAALVVLMTAALAIVLALAGTATFMIQRGTVVSVIDAELEDAAHQLTEVQPAPDGASRVETVIAGVQPEDYPSTTEYLRALLRRTVPDDRIIALGLVNGRPVLRTPAAETEQLADDQAFIERVIADTTAVKRSVPGTVHAGGSQFRFIAFPVSVPGSDPGVYIRAVNLTDRLSPPMTVAVSWFSAISVLLLALSAVGLWLLLPVLMRRGAPAAPGSGDTQPVDAAAGHTAGHQPPDGADAGTDQHQSPSNEPVPAAPRRRWHPDQDSSDQAESAFEAQRRLLDDVRHELKTPITIVRGHLEMMDVEDPNDVAATREIGMSELDRMTRMVEDIDLLATVQDDEYTMGVVSIATLTARLAELVVMVPGHPWELLDSADTTVQGNADRLLQAWLALAENAAKYTPAGSRIEFGSTVHGDAVGLWVRDHGPGIPPAMRHRIFRRFDRGGGRRDVGGSGLGLAIVDAIARAHGGSCTVADTPGGGATFSICLPHRPRAGAGPLPAPVRAGYILQQREDTP